jgi:alpha-N-acetylglucosaminidase
LVNKIDLLLDSHSLYKLDSWIEKARLWGNTPEEKLYFEADAKRIITLWGSNLTEYAARLWSGLLSGFYMPRWEAWFEKTKNKEGIDIKVWGMNWIETSYNKEHHKTANPFEIIHELEKTSKIISE